MSISSRLNLFSGDVQRENQRSMLLSNLSLGNIDHQARERRTPFRRSFSIVERGRNSESTAQENSVAWQTMCQHLNLQLEEHQRATELATHHHRRQSSLVDTQQPTTINIEPGMTSVRNKSFLASYSPSNADLTAIEDRDILTTDIHIVPMATLVERLNSNLREGLTDDIVAQHRTQFGYNKLRPPPKPSLLWMFIKQSLIGFNGILWLATLFAFLSYVSKISNLIEHVLSSQQLSIHLETFR